MEDNLSFLRIRIDSESRLINVIWAIIIGLYIRNASYILSFFSTNNKQLISIIIRFIILLFILAALNVIIRLFSKRMLFSAIVSVTFVLIHMLIFSENNSVFFDTISTFIFSIFPGMLCIYCIFDYRLLYHKLINASYIVSLLNIFVFISLFSGRFVGSQYSMGFSDALVFPTNVLIAHYFIRNKKNQNRFFSSILILFNCVTIVLFGSRGSLISIFVFFLLMILKKIAKKDCQSLIRMAILVLLALGIVIFSDSILLTMINVFNKLGLSSRSLQLLISRDFLSNNGRFDIWETIINGIKEHPFLIRGINADQLLKTGFYHTSNYSHNLFLELIYSFGVILGGLISIVFFIGFYKTCKQNIKNDGSLVELLLLSPFLPACLWSGSLWINLYCWLWVGFRMNRRNNPDHKKVFCTVRNDFVEEPI